MDYRQKKAAMQKLAQVRLAINHVLRQRALQKEAAWETHTPDGNRTWWGYFRNIFTNTPRFVPGSPAERDARRQALETSDRFLGQGLYANPGTPQDPTRAADAYNSRTVRQKYDRNLP